MSHRRPAFTLIELVIVLVILAVIAAIALPSFALLVETTRESVAERTADAVAKNARAIASADDARDANSGDYAISATEAGASWDADTLTVTVGSESCTVEFTDLETGDYDPAACPGGGGGAGTPAVLAAWGSNFMSVLGNGTSTDTNVPVSVDASGALAGTSATAVSGGTYHTCAIADGSAYCWGYGGLLGDGTAAASSVPVAVDTSGVLAGKTVTAVSAGGYHTCAIASGQAYCWGVNNYGQMGNGATIGWPGAEVAPVAVSTAGVLAGKTVTAIDAGLDHTCAIASGQVYCWGENNYGQLGNNSTTRSSTPVAVDTSGVLAGRTVTAISAGSDHTCAIADGAAYCWGWNTNGQLGNNSTTASSVPVEVDTSGALAAKAITTIAAGGWHTCAVASGAAYCWGLNEGGQLGNGNGGGGYFESGQWVFLWDSPVPVAVSTSGVLAGKTVTAIAGGGTYTCAVASGAAYCWGTNTYGQLGNGNNTNSFLPTAVSTAGVLSGKTVSAVATGASNTFVIAN